MATPDHERAASPHMVYRFYDANGALLYIGCSGHLFERLGVHFTTKSWFRTVVQVKVNHYPDWPQAARAEAAAILAENPRYNVRRSPPENCGVGTSQTPKKRSHGWTCPRCHGIKEDRERAYCKPCYHAYRVERKQAAGWTPRLPPTTICPRCKGEKESRQDYCKPCKKQDNRVRYLARKAARANDQ